MIKMTKFLSIYSTAPKNWSVHNESGISEINPLEKNKLKTDLSFLNKRNCNQKVVLYVGFMKTDYLHLTQSVMIAFESSMINSSYLQNVKYYSGVIFYPSSIAKTSA